MTQQQTQSQNSGAQSQSGPDQAKDSGAKRQVASPYEGPADHAKPARRPDHVLDEDGPQEMEQPYFSEAQSTLGGYAPTERLGDPFAQPEDALGELTRRPAEQPGGPGGPSGAELVTESGTVREGMSVVDSYGHVIGTVAGVEGDRLRLSSHDSHDDGAAFLPISLIDGVDGDRVLLSGRGDASFGLSES